ncbi:hypothetical protein KXX05_006353 [Aspergillus fumigatus]|nr:hypothetical protein KXX05_006353 [Aspergillus fumigatus]
MHFRLGSAISLMQLVLCQRRGPHHSRPKPADSPAAAINANGEGALAADAAAGLRNVISGARNSLAMLIIDIHAQRPATASASLAFFRLLAGAGVAAAMVPLIKAIGIAWTGTLVAATWLIVSPTIFTMHRYGHNWRRMDNSSKS